MTPYRWLLRVFGLSVLLVAGCAGLGSTEVPTETVTVPDPPPMFSDRTSLPDCGEVTIALGGQPHWPDEIIECLGQAEGGEAGQLEYTVEGDPIWKYVRTGPQIRGVDVYTDHTEDRYGTQAWTHQSCPGSTVGDIAAGTLSCTDPVWLVND